MNKLQVLSFLIGALAHDLGHGGFTNPYHVNAVTGRAIDSNDLSVMEHYHASQLFRILSNDETNPFLHFAKAEFLTFRKLVIKLILATDMSMHQTHIMKLKAFTEVNELKPDREEIMLSHLFGTENYEEDAAIHILENAMHACDISYGARDFHVVHEWTYLLFTEFFV